MVVVSYSGKEINAKLVYYGPGLSGKTTNLEFIYGAVPKDSRGKMVSMKTRTERTLFFDFLPVDLGQLGGFKTRFLLYTVPGQVYYNATRKLVLRGVDGVIFVADSGRGKMKENLESLANLRDNLKDYDLDLDTIPYVIQYNKRDLPDVYTLEELEKELNPSGIPYYEATATSGEGVFETFKGIGAILLQKLKKEVKLEEKQRPTRESVAAKVTAAAEAAGYVLPAASSSQPAAASPQQAASAGTPEKTKARSQQEAKPRPKIEPETGVVLDPAAADTTGSAWVAPPPSTLDLTDRSEHPADGDGYESASPAEEKRGFLGRIFGRKKRAEEDDPETMAPEPVAASRPAPAPVPVRAKETAVIEKRIQVPVTLTPEEAAAGATLRLVIEVQVQTESAGERAA